jgi:predicted PurR-regulated permease PerM
MIDKILKDRKLIITIIILGALIFVIYSSLQFLSAFFGAIALYFILNPLHKVFVSRFHFSKRLSAIILIIISILLIIIPIFFLIQGLLSEVKSLPDQLNKINNLNKTLPFELDIKNQDVQNKLLEIMTSSAAPFISNILNTFVILFLMFVSLYYLFVHDKQIKKIIYENMPFTEENKQKIIQKFNEVTYGTIIGTFIIAVVQGALLAINFYLLGISNAIFWGFITMIVSFLPVVGPPFIWIPASIFLFLSGETAKGIAIIIAGIMLTSIDNVIRPMINQKYGSIHPLITIFGVYIGISQFGLAGIFIGPLILVYLILFWNIYKETYLKKNDNNKFKIPQD